MCRWYTNSPFSGCLACCEAGGLWRPGGGVRPPVLGPEAVKRGHRGRVVKSLPGQHNGFITRTGEQPLGESGWAGESAGRVVYGEGFGFVDGEAEYGVTHDVGRMRKSGGVEGAPVHEAVFILSHGLWAVGAFYRFMGRRGAIRDALGPTG